VLSLASAARHAERAELRRQYEEHWARAMNFIQTKDDLIRKLEKDHDRAEDALFSLLPREKRSALEVRFHDLPPINQKLGEPEDSVCVALFGAWKRNALAKVLATATILLPERL